MSLITKRGKEITEKALEAVESQRGHQLTEAILRMFDRLALNEPKPDEEIERLLIEEAIADIEDDKSHLDFVRGRVTFSPSSADKCDRNLFYKASWADEDEQTSFPYQGRWRRNASAVHSAVQRDLLYCEKVLENPEFIVMRSKRNGRPAWEKNIRTVKHFEHNGVKFSLYGMCDGVLRYEKDKSVIGFEYKTKSTTLGAIGPYKLKDAQDSHKAQAIAYSLLFGLDEFIFVYESLAKDSWNKGEEAKPDQRAFYLKVTDEMRTELLDKFAEVARKKYAGELPDPDFSKCTFCTFKEQCQKDEGVKSA